MIQRALVRFCRLGGARDHPFDTGFPHCLPKSTFAYPCDYCGPNDRFRLGAWSSSAPYHARIASQHSRASSATTSLRLPDRLSLPAHVSLYDLCACGEAAPDVNVQTIDAELREVGRAQFACAQPPCTPLDDGRRLASRCVERS
jgi:hypothetical protein